MENIGGIFLVFLNVVTPVFILVVIGYFVGPRLKIEARSFSRTAYFVFVPAFVFNIISEAKIDSELALQMLSFILVVQIAVALLGFLVGKALRQSREITAALVLIATFGNFGNFGMPLIVFRLGETARTYATVYFVAMVFISFVICVGVASWARSGGITAVFSVFKRTAENPLYRIEKRPKLRSKQGMYALIGTQGQVLKRGHDLKSVLGVLERRLIRMVD